MLSEEFKSLSRKIFATIVFLAAIPEGREKQVETAGPGYAFGGEKIRAVIDFRNDLYNPHGLPGGFSYEMARRFAGDIGLPVEIIVSDKGTSYSDSLIAGRADILIRKICDSLDIQELTYSIDADSHTYWIMKADRETEINEINQWLTMMKGTREYSEMRSRFYSLYNPYKRLQRAYHTPRLSPYDHLIKKHACHIGWDWRLLAAVMYQESKFAINTVSHRGAQGLMQVMPRTAAYYGITDLLDPELNIEAGCRHFARLQRMFGQDEFLPEERVKFTLAAYNAGEGRIADCRRLAGSRGLDNTKWDDVASVIPDMRHSSILNETSVKYGRFRGEETLNYVANIMAIYDAFCEIAPLI